MTTPCRLVNTALIALTMVLGSCGGGTTTAGVGGSGIGGTGITKVSGNIVQVSAQAPSSPQQPSIPRMFASVVADWISPAANAQTGSLAGIIVRGGGQSTTTDAQGNFLLEGVTPANNFVLTFVVEEGQPITLSIGSVPSGVTVRVVDVVVDTNRGAASAARVEIQESPDPGDPGEDGSGEGGSGEGGSGEGGSGEGGSGEGGSGEGGSGEGGSGETTQVCHQTGAGEVTLTINEAALSGHLAHGDTVGPCD